VRIETIKKTGRSRKQEVRREKTTKNILEFLLIGRKLNEQNFPMFLNPDLSENVHFHPSVWSSMVMEVIHKKLIHKKLEI